MTFHTHSARASHWLGASATNALVFGALITFGALGACTKSTPPAAATNPDLAATPIATLPLSDAPAQNAALAPPLRDLPSHPIRRAQLARPHDRYAFADRANQMNDAFGDAPPDYSFDYQGTRPWAWRGDDGYQTVVEHLPRGGERHYYYEPGSDAPFLVRDSGYAYGYENGALVMVYDHGGNALSPYDVARRADEAGRILYRAQLLFEASRRTNHYAVARDDWGRRRSYIDGEHAQWAAQRDQNPDWRDYHQQYVQQQPQSPWAQERFRREAEAARIDQANNNAAAAARERQAAIAAVALVQAQNRARNDQTQDYDRARADLVRQGQMRDAAVAAGQDQQRAHDRAVVQAQEAARIDQIVRQQAMLQQNASLAREAAVRQHLQDQQNQQNLQNAQAAQRAAQMSAARSQAVTRDLAARQQALAQAAAARQMQQNVQDAQQAQRLSAARAQAAAQQAATRQQAQILAAQALARQNVQNAEAAQQAQRLSAARAQALAQQAAARQQAQVLAAQAVARQNAQNAQAAQRAQQLAAARAQALARAAAARQAASIARTQVVVPAAEHNPDVSARLKPHTAPPKAKPAQVDPVPASDKHTPQTRADSSSDSRGPDRQ